MQSSRTVDAGPQLIPQWGPYILPAAIMTAVLFVVPMCVFAANSVFDLVRLRGARSGFTLQNYVEILGDSFYWSAFWITLQLAAAVVVGTLLLGYPLAYVLARSRSKWRSTVIGIVLVTLFVSVVIRALGWKLILGPAGPINSLLLASGIISQPLRLSDNFIGTVIGLIHAELPFMILTLIPVIQLVPRSLEEAALSLGTPWWRVFWRVTLPLSIPGIVSGSLMVASLSMGAFTTPALLSGGREPFVPLLIEQQVLQLLNYPLGAALAVILVAAVLGLNVLVFRIFHNRLYGLPS